MTGIEQARADCGLTALEGFLHSLAEIDLLARPEALAELLAVHLSAATGGTALVVLAGRDGADRLAGCHPRSDLAEALLPSHRLAALVASVEASVGADVALATDGAGPESTAAREVGAVLAAAGVPRIDGLVLTSAGHRLGAALWCVDADAPAVDRRDVAPLVAVAAVVRAASTSVERERVRADQLQHALTTRIVVEQAKGLLAEQGDVSPEAAFNVLRAHCRRTNQRVQSVAADVVERRVSWASLS